MNRLMRKKTRDVADEDTDHLSTAPTENVVPAVPATKKKSWRWKKTKDEPEPEVNITAILPPADNFRTSLIMPNLSTRFSMLKEQEDPTSLLGKASDDSVLTPKRHSRLGDFGFTPAHLSDIAEISSLRSQEPSRPSLAPQRNGSYTFGGSTASIADDESTHSGSIMSRARPGEGNMLFGGRQKIYRIPIGDSGAVSNLGNGESRGMRGRALYEDDVSMSAFQRLREEEKLRQAEERLAAMEKDLDYDSINKDGLDSPALSYNERRETTSSTNSGPSMLGGSTAPTSIAGSSPGLPPVTFPPNVPQIPEKAKSRKLYEQGLDQHFQEQQSAALTRLTSLKRNTSLSGPYRSQSATNMHERFEKGAPSARNATTLPEDLPASSSSSQHRPSIDQAGPQPRSSTQDETETEKRAALWQCLDPLDRGMATAMGTFNKPKQFDEQQFLQRQMSLLQQQPKSRSNSTPKTPTPAAGAAVKTSNELARPRAATNRSDQSQSNSSPLKESPSSSSFPTRKPVPQFQGSSSSTQQSPTSASTGTFFAPADADEESDIEPAKPTAIVPTKIQALDIPEGSQAATSRKPAPPVLTHPALRSPPSSSPTKNKDKRRAWSPDDLKLGLATAGGIPKDYLKDLQNADSESKEEEELYPQGGSDLKGLVREHLRHPSNSSSVYPARTPGPEQTEFDHRAPSMYSTIGPWDMEDKSPALPSLETDFQQSDTDPFISSDMPEPTSAGIADWEQEMNRQHKRDASSETAHERLAFASELAQRQRTIQENLKFKAERGTPSPPSTARIVFENGLKPFGMLRNKPSSENLPAGRESPRPRTNGSGSDRSSSKSRTNRDVTVSPPPPIGRTLHSKLPEDGTQEAVLEYARIPRPSIEDIRPATAEGIQRQASSSTIPSRNPPSQSSPPQSSRTSMSKQRTASDASVYPPPADPISSGSGSLPRPSLDTARGRSDSSNTKGSIATASPSRGRQPRPQLSGLAKIATSSPTRSPRDAPGSATYSSNSTPPLSAGSTPNLVSGPSTSASTNTQSSIGNREQNIPTGFFFPSNSARSTSKEISRPTPRGRKNTVSKDDISEPTLIASTSEVSTVELPPGASLQNGLRNDFDMVLLGASAATSAAPAPTIPTGDKPRKGGLFSTFGRRDKGDKDELSRLPEDEPAPRRFKIKRMEAEEGKGPSRPMHKAFIAGEGSVDGTMHSIY